MPIINIKSEHPKPNNKNIKLTFSLHHTFFVLKNVILSSLVHTYSSPLFSLSRIRDRDCN